MHDNDEEVEVLSIDDDVDLDGAMDEALGSVEGSRAENSGDEQPESDPVAALEAEIRQLKEQNLRALADLENYRKRVARERAEERRFAGQEVLRDVLDVKDNLVRAVAAQGSAEDLRVGVEMTLRHFEQVLQNAGVERIEALDQPFDPAVHEAVQRVEEDGIDQPVVVDEMQRGYRLHERLLRPARVVVAVPAGEASSAAGGAEDGAEEE